MWKQVGKRLCECHLSGSKYQLEEPLAIALEKFWYLLGIIPGISEGVITIFGRRFSYSRAELTATVETSSNENTD